jgi:hypothetical protein
MTNVFTTVFTWQVVRFRRPDLLRMTIHHSTGLDSQAESAAFFGAGFSGFFRYGLEEMGFWGGFPRKHSLDKMLRCEWT